MSGSIGRSHYLPGQRVAFNEKNAPCDREGCENLAAFRVVTEADSFGCETADLCSYHYTELQRALAEKRQTLQVCDICQGEKMVCRDFRDPNEGSSGRVYNACTNCINHILEDFVGDDD